MRAFLDAVAAALAASGVPAAAEVAARLRALGVVPEAWPGASLATLPHLETALTAQGAHSALSVLGRTGLRLPWTRGDFLMPEGFAGRYAYCDLAGPGTSVPQRDFSYGLYLQFPDTWYPFHSHAAEEVYFVLSGTARWSREGVAEQAEAPGAIFRHGPHERHATRTGPEPVLALWAWLGDQDTGSYRIDPD